VAFGKTAEFIEKYFHKGMRIGGTGRIQTRTYENREGRKIYVTEIVLEQAEFVESKGQQTTPAKTSNKQSNDPLDGFMNIPDGIDDMELPFN
jgi:single-strand DNA-binding protein